MHKSVTYTNFCIYFINIYYSIFTNNSTKAYLIKVDMIKYVGGSWWRHQMETFYALLAPILESILAFVREFRDHYWIPWQRPSNAELWCLLCYWPVSTVKQTFDSSDIWDTMTLIWRHFNGIEAESSFFQRGIRAYTTIGSSSLRPHACACR